MPASPARAVAFEILLRVEREQSYAAELLHSEKSSRLSTADHNLATELVMGVLRWRSVLDDDLAGASSQKLERLDPEVLVALRLGVYQLQFLSRVPARAAIFESVELVKSARKRSAAPFANAVLRKISNTKAGDAIERIRTADSARALAASSAHPEWLIGRWIQSYGLEKARQICIHDQCVPVTVVRISGPDVADELAASGVRLDRGLVVSGARRVLSGDVTKTKAYAEGPVAIQDEASQLVALLVGHGERILDCCAAPGSKTSLIARQNPDAQVIAADLHPHRARLLRQIARQTNVRVLAADARELPLRPEFDRILADVPCSGTGTLARNPEIKWRLKRDDLRDLQERQVAILRSALTKLSPGGRLVYSTCSLEREEDEEVVERVLAEAPDFSVVNCREELDKLQAAGELAWRDLDSLVDGPYLRTLPGVHPCDGFFACIIQH